MGDEVEVEAVQVLKKSLKHVERETYRDVKELLQLVEHVRLRGAQDRSAVLELAREVDHIVLRFILVILFELCAGHLADVELLIGAFDVTGEEQDDSHNFLVSHDLLV